MHQQGNYRQRTAAQKQADEVEPLQGGFGEHRAEGDPEQAGDAEHADPFIEPVRRQNVGHEGEDGGKADRQADAVHGPQEQQQRITGAERVGNREIEQRRCDHQEAAEGIAALAADMVDHRRHPRAAGGRSQGEHAHDHTDIPLVAAVVEDVERQQEKGAETGRVAEVGHGHGPEGGGIEHRGGPFRGIRQQVF